MTILILRTIGFVIGIFLVTLSASMIVPILTLLIYNCANEIYNFLFASLITLAVGITLILPGKPKKILLRPRDMYLLTVSSWLIVCAFSALPFFLTNDTSYTDSFFESMSGITTTGATIFKELDTLSPGLLIWRSMLNWLGGIGFIAMAIAVLPLLRVGGMRLFQAESSDRSEKIVPRSYIAARLVLIIYLGITVVGTIAFWWAGMNIFDAINHSMAAISTGGFSTSNSSLGHWHQPAVHWTAVIIMLLGSLPFTLYVSTLRGKGIALAKDEQVQGLFCVLVLVCITLSAWLYVTANIPWKDALLYVTLNITSIITTTGFSLGDYTEWGNFALMIFFYACFIGGCSGSTSGGIKIFRFQIAYILLKGSLNQLIHPRAVIKQKYNGQRLDEEIIRSILTFSFFFAATICLIALSLSLLDIDWTTSLTAAAAIVSNVGPGLGETIGPVGNYSTLPDSAKWILTVGMLLGRLEIIPVLVLCIPAFWRH